MCRSGSACGCGGGGSGVPAALAVAVLVVAAVAVFVLTHVVILAAAAAVFAGGLGGFAVWSRRAARWPAPRRPVARAAVTAGPKAIEGARMTPQEVAAWMLATDHLALEREMPGRGDRGILDGGNTTC
jgi:hypothetical protein